MHLATADAKDERDALERKWEHLRSRAEQVGEAAEEVGEEPRRVYTRIRKAL